MYGFYLRIYNINLCMDFFIDNVKKIPTDFTYGFRINNY